MVAMDVQLDEKSTKLLLAEAKRFPKEVRRAFYYSCGITLRIMRGRMSGKPCSPRDSQESSPSP